MRDLGAFPPSIFPPAGFSIRAGSWRIQVNSPPNFFGNYPSLNRVFVCFYRVNVMSVFCTNPLIFTPESWKCTGFARNSPLPRLQISSLPRVFSFSSAITVGRTKRLKGFQTFFKVYFLFTHGSMTASMTYLYMHSVLCPF